MLCVMQTDATVMIDCALSARDNGSKMAILAPQIKTCTLPLGFQAMAEWSVEDYVVFYALCIKMPNQNIR